MPKIVLDGIERDVRVERGPKGTVVLVDGRPHSVSEVIHLAGAVAFLSGTASHVAYVSSDRSGARISLRGRTYLRSDVRMDADEPGRGAGAPRDGRVEAPMPGSIIAVHVRAGDTVKAGQPLVVLESMKMHNEITAPIDGVVRSVHCEVGDQIGFGQVLVETGAE
jgi:biotin carboxyl carrier protein